MSSNQNTPTPIVVSVLSNINDTNQFITNAYDYTESLIAKDQSNEDQIITNYINFIIQYKSNENINKSYVRSSTINDKLPIDLNVYNSKDKTIITSNNF
jgi:hypothetical protein